MPRYAAFLRGVNLGARRKAPAATLREACEAGGFTDVATFQTSGNVILTPGRAADEPTLRSRVEEALERTLGFEVIVFLRSADEVLAIARREPFERALVDRSQGKLQVSLLPAAPSPSDRDRVLAMASSQDLLAIDGRELYWLPAGGTLESELDRAAIERLIGPTTTRTMGTIERLAAKFFAA